MTPDKHPHCCMQIAQLRTLLNVMNDIVRKCNNNALGMVMGDFNSTPQSAVYRFIKAGELDCQTVPRKHVSGQVQGTSWPAALEKVSMHGLCLMRPCCSVLKELQTFLASIADSCNRVLIGCREWLVSWAYCSAVRCPGFGGVSRRQTVLGGIVVHAGLVFAECWRAALEVSFCLLVFWPSVFCCRLLAIL